MTFPEHPLRASLVLHTGPTATLLGTFPAEGGRTPTPGSRRAREVLEAVVTCRVQTQPSATHQLCGFELVISPL